jgi:hypothetical protein
MVDQDSNCRWLTLDGRMVTKHRRGVIDKSKLNRSPRPSPHSCSTSSCFLRFETGSRCPTTITTRSTSGQDKSDAPGSTRHVPVVHHATHRCLTPTRKINSGENHYEAYKLARQRACPPSALPLVLLCFVHRRAWLFLCLLEGYQGMNRLRGMKKARESGAREGGGTPFLLPSEPVIDFLFIISEFPVDVVHCTIKDPPEDSCMAIYRKCASAKRTHTLPCPRLLRYQYQNDDVGDLNTPSLLSVIPDIRQGDTTCSPRQILLLHRRPWTTTRYSTIILNMHHTSYTPILCFAIKPTSETSQKSRKTYHLPLTS